MYLCAQAPASWLVLWRFFDGSLTVISLLSEAYAHSFVRRHRRLGFDASPDFFTDLAKKEGVDIATVVAEVFRLLTLIPTPTPALTLTLCLTLS